ncbi:C4-dicarboxylate transport protein (plasmid) [Caballeronia sp. SBC1]|uniref:dicarboxylate/amino acid:cation symporter n=1 Tax=unclassified Caballeronia TaxID=2646786 RepID=UPI0013E1B834|nr:MULTISPECIES: dicarboxylate/amino acid:cation symporter [unclassified Caballeronia]QIE28968.1 C4-dicarboxylate transport protein [Caballeronia sp. SBC2]QIN67023.1 C4-dicarboxylate transport protein [Caballeronia sp. SBC1]
MKRKPFYRILYVQVIAAIFAGVLLGHFLPGDGIAMKPLGDAFIKLVRMIISPVIFCTVVTGIASMHDMRKVGRVGGKALLYFEIVSTVALAIGLLAAHLLQPGKGFNVDPSTLDASAVSGYAAQATHGEGLAGFFMHIIPDTFVGAFTQGDILPVLLIAMLFGSALAVMGEPAKPVISLIEALSKAFFKIVHVITSLAPIGAFGAMAFTIGKYGIESLLPMMKLIGTFYLTAFLFVIFGLGMVAKACGFSIFRFLAFIKDELLIVLGTSTSEAALPQLMEKLERLGCARGIVGLVVPTGYSFNLDGTNIYMTLAVLFLAQATNTHMTVMQEVTLLAVTMLTSKGSTGVTGAGFITLAASLSVVPTVPVTAMVLILGIDRFMSECRALTNIVGNGVATIVVASWEKELDRGMLHAQLGMPRRVGDVEEERSTLIGRWKQRKAERSS